MTVSTLETGVLRVGDGVTLAFSFPFEAPTADTIKVSTLVGALLTPVLTGFSAVLNPGGAGGTVTFSVAPANLLSLYIFRETPATQLVGVSSQQKYDPKVVESVWDKLTFVVQELLADRDRAVKFAPGTDADALLASIAAAQLSTDADAVAAAGSAVAAAASALAASTVVAGRNRIINGRGRVNQRGYVSGVATIAVNQYTLDRWRVVTLGQNLTFTGNDAGRIMTAPAGGCEQVIEAANIEGGTYIINWTGTATCTVNGTPRAKGATFTLPANTNATVRFTGGSFTDVQLELGSATTSFEWLDIGEEIDRCQRYFIALPTLKLFAYQGAGSAFRTPITFPRRMRATPAVAFTTPSYANASAVSTDAITAVGFNFGATATVLGVCVVQADASADAEL